MTTTEQVLLAMNKIALLRSSFGLKEERQPNNGHRALQIPPTPKLGRLIGSFRSSSTNILQQPMKDRPKQLRTQTQNYQAGLT